MKRYLTLAAVCVCVLGGFVRGARGQAEVTSWGNLQGIRVEGQLMEFGAGLCVVESDWAKISRTAKERQRPQYSRAGNRRTVSTKLGQLSFTEVVEDTGPGTAKVEVRVTSEADAELAGAFLCIALPGADYSGGTAQLIEPAPSAAAPIPLAVPSTGEPKEYVRATAKGVRFAAPRRQLEVLFDAPTEVILRGERRQGGDQVQAYLALLSGKVKSGQTAQNTFTLKAAGEIDKSQVELALDTSRPGRAFDGLGGNFRLQFPRTDPAVIEYNLTNLRVAWGRVEMPWQFWHPEENVDPTRAAEAGQLHQRVRQAMEMARTLAQRKIPVIVSAWSAPRWAIIGEPSGPSRRPGDPWGNPLNPEKSDKIHQSIAAYVAYLKKHYGVEAVMFSFNESDLGIYVRQTGEEHAALIKGLGAAFASRGLSTRMLLGDTSDATPTDFIRPAMEDGATWPYIGAVSFHSWRGWSDELLSFWGHAAKKLNVPLLVGEGSTDASAHRHPAIFLEPSFALEEINLYTRILALAEPKSILQWQLTTDYSILTGGGVYGTEGALRPTQRFWNLKQLASTPEGAFALPVTCGRPTLSCAAFGDIAKGAFAVHIVNNGAARPATLTGLPANLKELRVHVTDSRRAMEERKGIPVSGGKAQFTLEATSFTTVSGAQ